MGASSSAKRAAEAEAILKELRSVPPQHATATTVAAYQQAVMLLGDAEGSPLWFEAMAGLGSHQLESPEGDHATNVESAQAAYAHMEELASAQSDFDAWVVAVSGFANSLMYHPAATAERIEAALSLNDGLITVLRSKGDVERLAVTLARSAAAHAKMPVGDLDAHLETAIRLQEEAVRLVAEGGVAMAATRGRARHNLATLYAQRRTGLRSQNVDRAVRSLQAALEDRPAASDPIGRARTLRALALLYPEWSGADSLAHAQYLADSAFNEADLIEQGDVRASVRLSGWAYLEREQSALVDLDALYVRDRGERLEWLDAAIAHHREALRVLPRESMPFRWAEWMAGLGRLLGRFPSLGNWEHINEAIQCFAEAIEAFDPRQRPLLGRRILERWGEFCHEIADFEGSLNAYRYAADLSDLLLRAIADPDHRTAEVFDARGYALFGAYAAARLGKAEEAASMAERQRMRLHGDLLKARRAITVPGERRDAIVDAIEQLQHLDDALAALSERDPEATVEALARRLADFGSVDPSVVQMRRTDAGVDDVNPMAEERELLGRQIREARARMRSLIDADRDDDNPQAQDASAIIELAQASKCALVYLAATVHGGVAIAALPEGSCDVLLLDQLTSDRTRALVFGTEESAGFTAAALLGRTAELPACLDAIISELGPAAMTPISLWLQARGVDRAVLIPLGSVGLLPLHMAADATVVYSYAPSAGALALGRAAAAEPQSSLLVFANPLREDRPALPFTVAEGRAIVKLVPNSRPATILVRSEATGMQVHDLAPTSAYVHFGCHGAFRPSEPLASNLLLAGEDRLTLAEVFSESVDLSASRLVTLLACQSGNVEFWRTPDESLAFPSALLLGGVRAVVSTMWPVDDAAAALFTVRLYELLFREGLAPAEAVARARTWLRDASVKELQDRVTALRAHLEPTDHDAKAALLDLSDELTFSADEKPFGSPELWGPFIHTGIA